MNFVNVIDLIWFDLILFLMIILFVKISMEQLLSTELLIKVLKKLWTFWLNMELILIFKTKLYIFDFIFLLMFFEWIWMCFDIWLIVFLMFFFCYISFDLPLFIMLLTRVLKKLWTFWLDIELILIFKTMLLILSLLMFFDDLKNVLIDWYWLIVLMFFFCYISFNLPLFIKLLPEVLKKLRKFLLNMELVFIFKTKLLILSFLMFFWWFKKCVDWLIDWLFFDVLFCY